MSADGASRAATYFLERGLTRVLMEAQAVYYRNGRPAGFFALADATEAEHDGLAALTGRRPGAGPLRVRLADLDRALRESGFGCSLAELLAAWQGSPPASRPVERADRAARAAARADELRAAIVALEAPGTADPASDLSDPLQSPARSADCEAGGSPDDSGSLARRWLREGAHGREWLVRRGPADPAERAAYVAVARLVARALERLPLAEPVRLAVFANALTGDPHGLDAATPAGRLLGLALLDLFGAELGLMAAARLGTADRKALFERVGILTEGISSTVAVWNLTAATRRSGEPDPVVAAAAGSLLVLPLRRLLAWSEAVPAGGTVYAVENPTVFEDVVEALEAASGTRRAATGDAGSAATVICTAGWPSLAVWRLLDLSFAGEPTALLAYSGDFDLAGLRIALSVRERYPDRFLPWRLDAASYRIAIGRDRPARDEPIEGAAARTADLAALALPPLSQVFPELVAAIQATGRWAYQEAIGGLLAADVASQAAPSS